MSAVIPEVCKDLRAQEGAGSPCKETRGMGMPEEPQNLAQKTAGISLRKGYTPKFTVYGFNLPRWKRGNTPLPPDPTAVARSSSGEPQLLAAHPCKVAAPVPPQPFLIHPLLGVQTPRRGGPPFSAP